MALGQFTISFAQMEATVARAQQQSQQITELLDQMNRTITAQREHWLGSAADEFQSTYEWCRQQALTLPQSLDAAGRTLATVNEGTSTTESANATRFAQR
jgi:WXG100 family type VII secretion target